ncbi:hypothetical protein Tco_1339782 [Tanacetum coccineum]
MTNKIDTLLKDINDQMNGALPSDTVKNPKLNVNTTSLVSCARSYLMEDPQSSSRPFNFKPTNDFQKDQLQVKTITVNKIETPKSEEPERAFEDEFKDLHLKLPVLEVLAHAPMYNAILDKYVESLEKRILATASAVIDCKKAKIMVGEGVTRSIFGVKEIHLDFTLGIVVFVFDSQLQQLSDYYCWKDYADRDEIKD